MKYIIYSFHICGILDVQVSLNCQLVFYNLVDNSIRACVNFISWMGEIFFFFWRESKFKNIYNKEKEANRPLHPKLILFTFTLLISSTKGSLNLLPTPQFWTALISWTWFFLNTHYHAPIFHFLPHVPCDFNSWIRAGNFCEYNGKFIFNFKLFNYFEDKSRAFLLKKYWEKIKYYLEFIGKFGIFSLFFVWLINCEITTNFNTKL